jgi:rhodanese-related sulfurtransferase
VREPAEREIAAIPGALALPLEDLLSGAALPSLRAAAAGRPVVLHCRSGARSAAALRALRAAGVPGTAHLAGGILAWIDQVDETLPRY